MVKTLSNEVDEFLNMDSDNIYYKNFRGGLSEAINHLENLKNKKDKDEIIKRIVYVLNKSQERAIEEIRKDFPDKVQVKADAYDVRRLGFHDLF